MSLGAIINRKTAAQRNRILGVAIAIVGHLAIGMCLVLERPRMAIAPTTVIDIQLMPITRLKRPFDPSRQARRERLAAPKDQAPKDLAPRIPGPTPQTVQNDLGRRGDLLAPPGPPEVDPRLTATLRATAGCNATSLVHLSASEREACRQWARRLGAGFDTASLGVDPSKRLAFDTAAKRDWVQQPFLALKPKNGCVPRVTSVQDVPGAGPQDTTVGAACALSF